jgi:hypothetical protein
VRTDRHHPVLVYYSVAKNRHHSDAMRQGFNAHTIPVEYARMYPAADLHIVGGLQFGALEVLKHLRRAGANYLFYDRAYFGGGWGTNRLRIVRKAYQKNYIETMTPAEIDAGLARARAFGCELKPWRTAGDYILVVPPGEAICNLFGLGDWKSKILARLKACTDRPIDVSIKGDPRPLAERLARAHCVVTWTSNVAVDGIVAGVPAIVAPESAAAPLAGKLEQLEAWIDNPPIELDREPWVASLARGQWDLAEICRGVPRSALNV